MLDTEGARQLLEHGVLGAIIVVQWVVIKYLFDKAFQRLNGIQKEVKSIRSFVVMDDPQEGEEEEDLDVGRRH